MIHSSFFLLIIVFESQYTSNNRSYYDPDEHYNFKLTDFDTGPSVAGLKFLKHTQSKYTFVMSFNSSLLRNLLHKLYLNFCIQNRNGIKVLLKKKHYIAQSV